MSFGTKWETFNFSLCLSFLRYSPCLIVSPFFISTFLLEFLLNNCTRNARLILLRKQVYPLCEFTNLLNITKIPKIKRLSRSYLPNVLVVLNFLFNAVEAYKDNFLPTRCTITFGPMPISSWNTNLSCCNVGY